MLAPLPEVGTLSLSAAETPSGQTPTVSAVEVKGRLHVFTVPAYI